MTHEDHRDNGGPSTQPPLFDNRRRSYNGDISLSFLSDHTDGQDDSMERGVDDSTSSSAGGSPEKAYTFSFMNELAEVDRQYDEDVDDLEIAKVRQSLKRSGVADASDDEPNGEPTGSSLQTFFSHNLHSTL